MVTEYFILNSKIKTSNPDFNCFTSPLDTKTKISEVFLCDNCKWTESQLFFDAIYKTELAHIKIEIKRKFPYIFQLTVLGGKHPLYEVAHLCKLNSWNAYNIKTAEYLDLENPPKLNISYNDRVKHYDDDWDKINAIQIEQENNIIKEEEEKTHNIKQAKKWWNFWKK